MRILHLNEHLRWAGGVETYLLSLIPELESLGHENKVVYAKGEDNVLPGSQHMASLSLAGRSAEKQAYGELRRLLKHFQPDLVHVHQIYNTGAIQACLEGQPVVIHAHDYRYVCPASSFYFKRSREVCRRRAGPGCFVTTMTKHCLTPRPRPALNYYRRVKWIESKAHKIATVIAPSEAARQRYLAAGFSPGQVPVLPYFCPIRAAVRPRPMPKKPTVLFMGRVRPNKGVDYLIQAVAQLPEQVRAIVVGDFSPESRARVKNQAMQLGCLDRLELRDWAERSGIDKIYREATVFAFPSVWPETLGIVGLEALACGVPVVASDIGGVGEWLIPGKTGFFAQPKSAKTLADGIRKLCLDESLNLEFGQQGLELIRQRFSPRHHIRELLAVYESCLERRALPIAESAC